MYDFDDPDDSTFGGEADEISMKTFGSETSGEQSYGGLAAGEFDGPGGTDQWASEETDFGGGPMADLRYGDEELFRGDAGNITLYPNLVGEAGGELLIDGGLPASPPEQAPEEQGQLRFAGTWDNGRLTDSDVIEARDGTGYTSRSDYISGANGYEKD